MAAIFEQTGFVECQARISGRQHILDLRTPCGFGQRGGVIGQRTGFQCLQPGQSFGRSRLHFGGDGRVSMRLRAGLCLPVTEYGHDVRAIEAFVTGADPRVMGDATAVMGERDVLLVLLATAAASMAADTHLARFGR